MLRSALRDGIRNSGFFEWLNRLLLFRWQLQGFYGRLIKDGSKRGHETHCCCVYPVAVRRRLGSIAVLCAKYNAFSFFNYRVDHKNIISNENGAATGDDGSGKINRQFESHYFLVNGQHTGPALEVCKNDFLVIDVENRIPGRSIALHWTGQTQKRTPFMDGVPM